MTTPTEALDLDRRLDEAHALGYREGYRLGRAAGIAEVVDAQGGQTFTPAQIAVARSGAEGLDERLRRFLWLNHGHAESLYGDDGEMQCHACSPVWDYRRAPLASVLEAAEDVPTALADKGIRE